MFVVINKEKIYAYIVSILTVVVLFSASTYITSDTHKIEETSTSIENISNENAINNTKYISKNELNNMVNKIN